MIRLFMGLWISIGIALAGAFLLGVAFTLLLMSTAFAQEPEVGTFGYGHAAGHEDYKDWTNKGGGSCCSGQDCRPVRAQQDMDGKWSIWIPELRSWVPVPDRAMLETDKLHDGRSHACTADPRVWKEYGQKPDQLPVYCFTPAQVKS